MRHPSEFVVPVKYDFLERTLSLFKWHAKANKVGFDDLGNFLLEKLCRRFEHDPPERMGFYRNDFIGILKSCRSGMELANAIAFETEPMCDFIDSEMRNDFISACLSYMNENRDGVRNRSLPGDQEFLEIFFAQLPELMKQLGCRPQTSFVVVDELPPRTWTGLEVEFYV